MIQPTIIFYARLDFDLSSKKTPKYIITRAWGDYSPVDKIKGRNGMVSMYLLPKREVQPSNCPPMHLQGKNSLNITGLKDYFLDGKLSGFAYGYPLSEPTYGKDKKTTLSIQAERMAFCLLSIKTRRLQHHLSNKDRIT